jgi:prepilin-type N-terminal cleavage/methylation domain-containing protein
MRRSSPMSQRRPGAFTLIELLVVIAVIALLISILLPAIGQSRKLAQATICRSNLREMGTAVAAYAVDFKDRVWPKFDWAPIQYTIQGRGTFVGAGLLYQYVDNVDKISECPTNKRANLNGSEQQNAFGGRTGLNFDYTMVGRTEGVRMGSEPICAYVTNPAQYGTGLPPVTLPNSTSLTIMHSVPVYVEESIYYYNSGITDGLWGNNDQISQRHFNEGNVAFLDGTVDIFKVPHGPREDVFEARDFRCNDIFVKGRGGWIRLEPTNSDNSVNWGERPFGWLNAPH